MPLMLLRESESANLVASGNIDMEDFVLKTNSFDLSKDILCPIEM